MQTEPDMIENESMRRGLPRANLPMELQLEVIALADTLWAIGEQHLQLRTYMVYIDRHPCCLPQRINQAIVVDASREATSEGHAVHNNRVTIHAPFCLCQMGNRVPPTAIRVRVAIPPKIGTLRIGGGAPFAIALGAGRCRASHGKRSGRALSNCLGRRRR